MTEKIMGVALFSVNHGIIALPKPHRHHHLFALCAFIGIDPEPCEQGFTTNDARFVGRREAAKLVNFEKPELYSEDLW